MGLYLYPRLGVVADFVVVVVLGVVLGRTEVLGSAVVLVVLITLTSPAGPKSSFLKNVCRSSVVNNSGVLPVVGEGAGAGVLEVMERLMISTASLIKRVIAGSSCRGMVEVLFSSNSVVSNSYLAKKNNSSGFLSRQAS